MGIGRSRADGRHVGVLLAIAGPLVLDVGAQPPAHEVGPGELLIGEVARQRLEELKKPGGNPKP